MNIRQAIGARRATKHFQAGRALPPEDLQSIVEAAGDLPLAYATSALRLVRACDAGLRRRIRSVGFDQPQHTDASELMVVCVDLSALATAHPFDPSHDLRDEAMHLGAMAAQAMMIEAAARGIDSCPMIGFDFASVAGLVGLPREACLVMIVALGYGAQAPRPRGSRHSMDELLFQGRFGRGAQRPPHARVEVLLARGKATAHLCWPRGLRDATLALAQRSMPQWDTSQAQGELACRVEAGRRQLKLTVAGDASAVYLGRLAEDWAHRLQLFVAAGAQPVPPGPAFIERLVRWVTHDSQRPALQDGSTVWTYGELGHRVRLGVAALKAAGVGPGTTVALHLPRSAKSAAALLASIAAGAVYMPVDTVYPPAYISQVLAVGRPTLVVTDHAHAANIPSAMPMLMIEQLFDHSADPAPWPGPPDPQQPLTVLFTSGTTGTPKGVVHSHASFLRRFEWLWCKLPFGDDEVVVQRTGLGFGPHLWETLGGLLQGVRTVIVPDDQARDPQVLHETLVRTQPTRLGLVPSLLRTLLNIDPDLGARLGSLRLCSVAGEPLDEDLRNRFLRAFPRARLYTDFGSTEINGIFFCDTACRAPEEPLFPLGRPMPGACVAVLDEQARSVPIGAAGDLHVAGPTLALAYLDADGVHQPLPTTTREDGLTYFRTGDRVRFGSDGLLYSLGREDTQVKVRGMRVDLLQVEQQLQAAAGVSCAAVVAVTRADSTTRIAAAYEAVEGSEASQVAQEIKRVLPPHMRPDRLERMAALPRLPNGKVDRQSLARCLSLLDVPDNDLRFGDEGSVRHRLIELVQRAAVRSVADIATLDGVALGDLGIDSLSAVELSMSIARTFGIDLRTADLFACDTFGNLLAYIQGLEEGELGLPHHPLLQADRDRLLCPRPVWPAPSAVRRRERLSLLTGATGFLGAHVLHELLSTGHDRVCCLVRATDKDHGLTLLRQALERYGLWRDTYAGRIHVVVGDLRSDGLGLSADARAWLPRHVGSVFHCAAQVNHMAGYSRLRTVNVQGTEALIDLAEYAGGVPITFASTVGVCLLHDAHGGLCVQRAEELVQDGQRVASGYGQTKWLAEHLLWDYGRRTGAAVTIQRIGEIAGDSHSGRGRHDDIFHHCLKLFYQVAQSPELPHHVIDVVPVDFAARAFTRLVPMTGTGPALYHLTHPQPLPLQDFLRCVLPGDQGSASSLGDWKAKLLRVAEAQPSAYLPGMAALVRDDRFLMYFEPLRLARERTERALTACGLKFPPLDLSLMRRYVDSLAAQGFLHPTSPQPHAAFEHD